MIYSIVWGCWFLAFGVIETIAIIDPRPGGTLSENIWRLFRIRDRRPRPFTVVLHLLALAICVALTLHLALGWWSL